ncbi:AAA family ATPase [Actinokineospora sp. 24-640]
MLVERRDELCLMHGAYAECVAGEGRSVLVSGGLASGKTALLHAFAEQAADKGALPLTATGTRMERSVRMGVMWQLFRSAPLPAETLDRVSRLIDADPVPSDARDLEPHTMRHADIQAVHGLCAVLLDLAKDAPLVIVVDDLQFVDGATLQVLLYLRLRMRAERVLLVLGEWYRPGLARPFIGAEVTRQPHLRIGVDPLTEAGVAQLAAARLDPRHAARLAPELHAVSGGSPALARALIEDCARLAPDADRPVIGGAFRQAVLDCLHRWDPDVLRVAGGLAVLGEHARADLVAELLRIPVGVVGQLIDVLATAAIADGQRLRHPGIAATVLGGLPPETASALHVRAAELLDKHGVDAMGVAGHLVTADAAPGPWAVRVLRHAAEQVAVDDAAFAMKCLDLALRAAEDDRERVALRAALVRVAWRVNPSAAARHLSPLQGALRAGELTWRDAVPVIRHLLWQGDLDAAAAQLLTVSATAGPLDVRTTAELRLTCEWIYGSLREQVPDEVHALLTATERATSANPWVQTALLNRGWARGAGREVVPSAEHILQGCLGDMLPEVGTTALLALDDAERPERALQWCGRLVQEATRRRATTWQAVLGCVAADFALRRGDLVTAKAQASAALALQSTQSWGVLIGYPLSVLVLAETAMGNLDQATELLARPVPEAMPRTTFGARYLHASGHCHLAAGRTLAALEDFERSASWARGRELDVPASVPWRGDLAQALLRLGRRKEARAYASEQLSRAQAAGSARNLGIALRVLAACADPQERAALLGESVQHLERCADRLELARSLAELSQVHQEQGQLAGARLVLRKAAQLAKACQADVVPEDTVRVPVGRPPRDTAVIDDGAASLSEAERKVAELAAHGHTNREIGRRLYITVSTVEQHLTRVYRKLNVARRTDLPTELPPFVAAEREDAAAGQRVAMSR